MFRKSHVWTLLFAVVLVLSTVALAADYKFVGSLKSNKYHHPACSAAKQIKPENLVTFKTAKEAQEAGYIPCKICKPPLKD
ncbi:MAG: Ada metal-binding domain-containing protein [candidate division WOR-3 bacterium]